MLLPPLKVLSSYGISVFSCILGKGWLFGTSGVNYIDKIFYPDILHYTVHHNWLNVFRISISIRISHNDWMKHLKNWDSSSRIIQRTDLRSIHGQFNEFCNEILSQLEFIVSNISVIHRQDLTIHSLDLAHKRLCSASRLWWKNTYIKITELCREMLRCTSAWSWFHVFQLVAKQRKNEVLIVSSLCLNECLCYAPFKLATAAFSIQKEPFTTWRGFDTQKRDSGFRYRFNNSSTLRSVRQTS